MATSKDQDRPVPKMTPGSALSYQGTQIPILKTHRSANEWFEIAKSVDEITKTLGEVYIAKEKANNEVAFRAGILAEIQGQTKEGIVKQKGVHAQGHARVGFDQSRGKRESNAYDSERRRAADIFGQDPSNTGEMWVQEEMRLRTKWKKDHEINTEIRELAFEGGLDARASFHHNVFRQSNETAQAQSTINDALDEAAPVFRSIMDGSRVNPETPVLTPDGTPATDEEGNKISTPLPLVPDTSTKTIERSNDLANTRPDVSLIEIGESYSALFDKLTDGKPYGTIRRIQTALMKLAIKTTMGPYENSLVKHDIDYAERLSQDVTNTYDILINHTYRSLDNGGKTNRFNATEILDLKQQKLAFEKLHSNNIATLKTRIPLIVKEGLRSALPMIYSKDSPFTEDYAHNLSILPELAKNWLPEGSDSPQILNSLAVSITNARRSEINYQVNQPITQSRAVREAFAEKSSALTKQFKNEIDAVPADGTPKLTSLLMDVQNNRSNLTDEQHTALVGLLTRRLTSKSFIAELPKLNNLRKNISSMATRNPTIEKLYHETEQEKHNRSLLTFDMINSKQLGVDWEGYFSGEGKGRVEALLVRQKVPTNADIQGAFIGNPPLYDSTKAVNAGKLAHTLEKHYNTTKFTNALDDAIYTAILPFIKDLPSNNEWGLNPEATQIDFDAPGQTNMKRFLSHLIETDALTIQTILQNLDGNKEWSKGSDVNLEPFEWGGKPSSQLNGASLPGQAGGRNLIQKGVPYPHWPVAEEKEVDGKTVVDPRPDAVNTFREFPDKNITTAINELREDFEHYNQLSQDPDLDPTTRKTYRDLRDLALNNYRALSAIINPDTGMVSTSHGYSNTWPRLTLLIQAESQKPDGAINGKGELKTDHPFYPMWKQLLPWWRSGIGTTAMPANLITSTLVWENSPLFSNDENMTQATPLELRETVIEAWDEMFVLEKDGQWVLNPKHTESPKDNPFRQMREFYLSASETRGFRITPEQLMKVMVAQKDKQLFYANTKKFKKTPIRGLIDPVGDLNLEESTRVTTYGNFPMWLVGKRSTSQRTVAGQRYADQQLLLELGVMTEGPIKGMLTNHPEWNQRIKESDEAFATWLETLRGSTDVLAKEFTRLGEHIPPNYIPFFLLRLEGVISPEEKAKAIARIPKSMLPVVFRNYDPKTSPNTWRPWGAYHLLAYADYHKDKYIEYLEETGEFFKGPPAEERRFYRWEWGGPYRTPTPVTSAIRNIFKSSPDTSPPTEAEPTTGQRRKTTGRHRS